MTGNDVRNAQPITTDRPAHGGDGVIRIFSVCDGHAFRSWANAATASERVALVERLSAFTGAP